MWGLSKSSGVGGVPLPLAERLRWSRVNGAWFDFLGRPSRLGLDKEFRALADPLEQRVLKIRFRGVSL